MWDVHYGEKHGLFPVKDYGAIEVVAKLVGRPHQPVQLKELVEAQAVLQRPEQPPTNVLDYEAREAYAKLKGRWDELQRDRGDNETPAEEAERKEEILAITKELKKHKGLNGRQRKLGHTAQ